MKIKLPVIVAMLAACACSVRADDTPINLSLVPNVALFPKTTTVNGLALSIWGENPQKALAIGFINGSSGDSGGLSWGIVNYAESYSGVQWGAVNVSMENFKGWQHGYVNIAQGTFKGFQSGLLNVGEDTTGFQLGVINYAQKLHGLQIGAVNVAMNNSWFERFPDELARGFPILNWSF